MRKATRFATLSASGPLRLGIVFIILAGIIVVTGCGGTHNSISTPTQPTTPSITWATPSPITYGTALSATQLNASTTVAGSFSYNPASGTIPKAGTQTLSTTFTPNDTTNYTTATASVQLTVNKATPTVSAWPTASAIAAGQALSASTLSGGTASVPGAFAWTTPTTVPATGTSSQGVTFTPTDTANYTAVTGSVSVTANPSTPQITALTPRFLQSDTYLFTPLNQATYTITCAGCQNGDILHDAGGTFTDVTLNLSSGQTSIGITAQWEPTTYQPAFSINEIKHAGGSYGNQWATAFFASASQSTLTRSAVTGTLLQVEQSTGQIYWKNTAGQTGKWFNGISAGETSYISADDATGKVVRVLAGEGSKPQINVYDENGDGGFSLCTINPTGMSFVSSVAAHGGYMVFTDPADNLVGIAKMDCTGYKTVSVAGQPWSVAMSGTKAYVLSRDRFAADGKPGVTRIDVPTGTVANNDTVELPSLRPVSVVRATTPQEGIYQVVAFANSPMVAVLYMGDQTDGEVVLVNTSSMAVADTVQVPELPFALAPDETGSTPSLLVSYILATGGESVTHIGRINVSAGVFTANEGSCLSGILAGGSVMTSSGFVCAMGSTIASPVAVQQ